MNGFVGSYPSITFFLYIVDLFDQVQKELGAKELCIKPLGGGMMKINCDNVTIYGQCKVS